MLRVIVPENHFDVKLMVDNLNLPVGDMHISRIAFEMAGNDRPKLVLEFELFTVDAEFDNRDLEILLRKFGSGKFLDHETPPPAE